MKRTIAGLALLVMAAISVNAQQPDQPEHQQFRHHGHHRDRMAKTLNFSDQQKEQLKKINSDYHEKMMDLKKHDEITVKDFKSQLAALHKDHRAQMQALLTPVQKDQLATMKQEKNANGQSKCKCKGRKNENQTGTYRCTGQPVKDHPHRYGRQNKNHSYGWFIEPGAKARADKKPGIATKRPVKKHFNNRTIAAIATNEGTAPQKGFFKISVLMDE